MGEAGRLEAIWVKRMKRGPMDPAETATLVADRGIVGNANQGGKRQVTVIEREAFEAVREALPAARPVMRRANLMVSGVRLEGTRGRVLRVGGVRILLHGETRPCERMDEQCPGLRAALDPHWRGGAYGTVLDDGEVRLGDAVSFEGASARPRTAALALAVALAATAALATPATAQRWTLPDSVQRGIDDVFAFVERDAPGCALGVVRDGKLAYGRGYGLANLDWKIPISTSAVFDIGSVSKQFTATAIALLDMDGVLSIDDDVRRWIPELPDYGAPIRIRHLLHHTSGVRDYLTLLSLAGFDYANVFDEQAGIDVIVRQKALNFAPGSAYLYSNSGYLMLAHIVRRATGRSLRAFLEERVFDPLGMAHTSVWDDNTEIVAERATGYAPDGSGGWEIDHAWNFQMGGDGQVVTSIEDLAKWDANFYDPEVGGAGLLERLHTRGVLTGGDTIGYALGLSLDEYRGLRRVQHGGSWAGFRAMLARFPEQRTSVVVACNRADADPGAYAGAVADLVLAGVFPQERLAERPVRVTQPEPPTLTPTQLERWAGSYRHPDRPEYVAFEVREGALHLVRGTAVPLTPVDASTFRARTGAPIRFSDRDGRARVTNAGGTYDRVALAAPSADELDARVGPYYSPELEATFEIGTADGALTLRRPGRDPVPLRPGRAGEFLAPGATLTFLAGGGAVTGFEVYAGRVTGIVFERRTSS